MNKIPYINEKPLYSEAGSIIANTAKNRKTFTFEEKFDEGEFYVLYRHINDKWMEVPRKCTPLNADDDRRTLGKKFKLKSGFKPRNSEQKRVVEESTDLLQKGHSHILSASTGFGKTIIGSEIAGRIGVTTLIVVTKSDIIQQWVDSIIMLFGVTQDDIGYIGGDVCNVAGKRFVIGMVQSLCKPDRYPTWVYKEFGLIIFDEVHRMGADVFSQAIWHFPAKLRLGLSATTDRKDGKDIVFKANIGNVMVSTEMQTLIPKVIVDSSNWRVPMTKKKFKRGGGYVVKEVPIPHSAGRCMHIYKMMARSPTRNTTIARFVLAAYQQGRNIVVFSDLKDSHLLPLRKLFIQMGIPAQDIGMYVGVSTKADKAQREKEKVRRVILTTYKMTSEATDVPWWDTAVLATPRSDVVQIVGRIRREYEGKKQPVVFDLIDGNSDVFKGYSYQRRKWYESIGCDIVRYDK